MRNRAGLAGLTALLAASALSALTGYAAARASTHDQLRAVPIDEVLVSADGRTLSASLDEPCIPAAALRATESTGTVTVALVTAPHEGTCSSGTESRTWTANLSRPLGSRTVMDEPDGREVPVFNERDLLRPAYLPTAYVHVYDAATYAPDPATQAADWDTSCAQLYQDAQGDQLWITQGYGIHWPPNWSATLPLIPVRHSLARALPGTLAWTENRKQSFLLTSIPSTGSPLSVAQLAAVADSLPPSSPAGYQ